MVAPWLLGCPGTRRQRLVSAARRGFRPPDKSAAPGTFRHRPTPGQDGILEQSSGLLIRWFGVRPPGAPPGGLHVSCGPSFTFWSDIRGGRVVLLGPGGSEGAGGALWAVPGLVFGVRACLRCCRAGVRAGGGCWAAGGQGQGGPAAAVMARVLRRRLRVFGGRPLAARRWFSSCRAFYAVRIRWLRTASSVTVNSMRGARPIRRQPRAMSLLAGSLAVAKPRSAPVRRA